MLMHMHFFAILEDGWKLTNVPGSFNNKSFAKPSCFLNLQQRLVLHTICEAVCQLPMGTHFLDKFHDEHLQLFLSLCPHSLATSNFAILLAFVVLKHLHHLVLTSLNAFWCTWIGQPAFWSDTQANPGKLLAEEIAGSHNFGLSFCSLAEPFRSSFNEKNLDKFVPESIWENILTDATNNLLRFNQKDTFCRNHKKEKSNSDHTLDWALILDHPMPTCWFLEKMKKPKDSSCCTTWSGTVQTSTWWSWSQKTQQQISSNQKPTTKCRKS